MTAVELATERSMNMPALQRPISSHRPGHRPDHRPGLIDAAKDKRLSGMSGSSISDQASHYHESATTASLEDSVQQRVKDNPQAFRNSLEQAFGGKADPAALDNMASMAANGKLPLPENVEFVDAGTLGPNALGAYDDANGGTIYLDRSLLSDPKALESVYTEELGHHLDAELGGQDAAGDEGAIFSQSLLKGAVDAAELVLLKSENDSGFIDIDGERVAVEFNGYTGPGSSVATGGTSSSSSSSTGSASSSTATSSYSGPGSSSSTGGSGSSASSRSASSSGSSSSQSYSGPGSSESAGAAGSGGSGSGNTTSGGSSVNSSRTASRASNSTSSYSGPGSSSYTGGTESSSNHTLTSAAPAGLTGAALGLGRAGYTTLVNNPELTVRYETTRSAVSGKSGFSDPAATSLETLGFDVERTPNATPPNSRIPGPGDSRSLYNTYNGDLASDAIADRYRANPAVTDVVTEFRYDANLDPVPASVRNHDQLGDRRVDVRVQIEHPTDPRLNQVIEIESKATRVVPSSINESQVAHDAARLVQNGNLRGAGQALESVGRVARPVGVILDTVNVVSAYRADGNQIGENTGRAVSGVAGGAAVGWGGAVGGAALGTMILPGPGTVIGGIIGAAAGAFVGDVAGRGIFDSVKGWFGD